MRIRPLLVLLITLGLATAVLSGCTSSKEESAAQQSPFEYYRSTERAKIIQVALDTIGNNWMRRMIATNIPGNRIGWAPNTPAPENGYGVLASATEPGEGRYVQVSIKYKDGDVDYDEKPVGLFAITEAKHTLSMAGEGPLVASPTDTSGVMVPGSPFAYSWVYSPGDDGTDIRNMKLVDGDNVEPPYDKPLNPDAEYKVVGGRSGSPSIEEIKELDKEFLDALRAVNVDGLDWE